MRRRALLAGVAAGVAGARVGRAQGSSTLRFIPQADLAILDPHLNTAYVTRNHGYMVYDTLYGLDDAYRPSGQMVAGHSVEDDGTRWVLTLRDGLAWHDGSPVLARDCVASVKRWGAKDTFGQALLQATDELSADGDRRIVFRLKHPFPLLPAALGKPGVYMPAMMPERLARTDPGVAVTEIVGSGPFRWKGDERIAGARAVWVKNDGYVPRPDGVTQFTAGPKRVFVDRVVWTTVPDPATAAAALQAGEADWWEYASADLVPLLRRDGRVVTRVQDPAGSIAVLRMNHLQPPFDNAAVRRVVEKAVVQADFMTAMLGDDRALWRDGVGVFTPGTPLANDADMAVLDGRHDVAGLKAELAAAGYTGAPVVVLVPSDFPNLKALSDVGAAMLRGIGMNVDYQALDWATVLARRAKMGPVSEGGWSVFFTFSSGLDAATPASNTLLRGTGKAAFPGWPDDPEMERLRDAWFVAGDLAGQQGIAREMQRRAFGQVPYVPLGQYFQPTAYRKAVTGVLDGFATFWNVRLG